MPDPENKPMVRKQLYIEPAQDAALKARARSKGITEAAVVRDALNRHLFSKGLAEAPSRAAWVEAFMASGDRLAEALNLEPDLSFNRDDLYQERSKGWE